MKKRRLLGDFESAWAEAADIDVVRALQNPADYAPEVFAIVEREAARRGVDASSQPSNGLGPERQMQSLAARLSGFFVGHRRITAGIIGTSFPVGRILVYWSPLDVPVPVEFATLTVLYLFTLAITCWPLHSHRVVFETTLVAATAFAVVGTLTAFPRDPGGIGFVPWILPIGTVSVFLLVWMVSCAVLCTTVTARKRFWPIHPPGHCNDCGYNLFGLTTERCPECGTAFNADDVVDCDGQSLE